MDTHNVELTRVFDAPLEKAWAAWSTSEGIKQWWGPRGFTCPLANVDFRGGGVTLVCMRAPAEYGGMEIYNTWTYTTIVPRERIEYVLRFSDSNGTAIDPAQAGLPPGVPAEVPHTIIFRPVGSGQTEVAVTEFGYPTPEARDLSKSGMSECLDKMAEALT